jgi:hypothetical protein
MALTAAEKSDCVARVEELLLVNFNGEFQDHYSIVAATCGLHPEQVNNELRNMLTHIARAFTCEDVASFNAQLASAKNHLERASRDCLKLANLKIFQELQSDCFYLQMRDKTIPRPLRAKLTKIESMLFAARKAEVAGGSATVEDLLLINAELQELRKDYEHAFIMPGWKPSRWRSFRLWVALNWQGFVTGALSALIGVLIKMLLS